MTNATCSRLRGWKRTFENDWRESTLWVLKEMEVIFIFMGMFYKGFSKELSHIGFFTSGSWFVMTGFVLDYDSNIKIRLLLIFQDLCV
jgi:hypothetical protein